MVNFGDKFASGHCCRFSAVKITHVWGAFMIIVKEWSQWTPEGVRSIPGAWDSHPIIHEWRRLRWHYATTLMDLKGEEAYA